MLVKLPNPELRKLRAAAQHLKATFKIGKAGLSAGCIQAIDEALRHQPLLKVKFEEFKEQRKELARLLVERTASHLILQVGHVVVLYRPPPPSEPPAGAAGP